MTPCPNDIAIIESAKTMSWCWPVENVLADKNFYLRLVMQYGEEYIELAEKHFTKEDFIEAIEAAPPGFFWSFVWHGWREKLGLPKKKMPTRFPQNKDDPEDWWRGKNFSKKY